MLVVRKWRVWVSVWIRVVRAGAAERQLTQLPLIQRSLISPINLPHPAAYHVYTHVLRSPRGTAVEEVVGFQLYVVGVRGRSVRHTQRISTSANDNLAPNQNRSLSTDAHHTVDDLRQINTLRSTTTPIDGGGAKVRTLLRRPRGLHQPQRRFATLCFRYATRPSGTRPSFGHRAVPVTTPRWCRRRRNQISTE